MIILMLYYVRVRVGGVCYQLFFGSFATIIVLLANSHCIINYCFLFTAFLFSGTLAYWCSKREEMPETKGCRHLQCTRH